MSAFGRWKKRIHGKYSRDGDLLTVRTTSQLIEELQDQLSPHKLAAMQLTDMETLEKKTVAEWFSEVKSLRSRIAELERFKAGALKLTTAASVEQVLK